MRSFIVFVVVLTITSWVAVASQEQAPARPDVELTKSLLAKFIGRWEGESRTSVPGIPEQGVAQVVETAQWKLGGTAMLVEGRGTIKNPETGEEQVIHDALGIMRFDPISKTIRFIAMKANEPMIETELKVLENGDFRWGLEHPSGRQFRFTISLTETTWVETGEITSDAGATWHEFLQMNLKRVAEE